MLWDSPGSYLFTCSGEEGSPVTEVLLSTEGLPFAILPKPHMRTIVDVAVSSSGAAFLDVGGEVLVMGLNDEGQLAPGSAAPTIPKPTLLELLATHRVASLALSDHHAAAVTSNGGLLTWGSNEYLALGHSKDASPFRVLPRVPRGLPPPATALMVSCGESHTLVLTTTGQVYAAGSGARGALGLGDRESRAELCLVSQLRGVAVSSVFAGEGSSHAISVSGLAYSWGGNRRGQCGLNPRVTGHAIVLPTRVGGLPELVRAVAAGANHTLWVSRSGRLYGAGLNKHGQLGMPPPTALAPSVSAGAMQEDEPLCLHQHCPVEISIPGGLSVREVAAGEKHSLVLCVNSNVYAMGEVPCAWMTGNGTGSGGEGGSGAAVLRSPTLLEQLSRRGLFRLSSWGSSACGIRVVNGTVFSTLPGTLPKGIQLASAPLLIEAAKAAGETGDTRPLKAILEVVLGTWSGCSGSFLSTTTHPLLVETRAPGVEGGAGSSSSGSSSSGSRSDLAGGGGGVSSTPSSPSSSTTGVTPSLLEHAPEIVGAECPTLSMVAHSGIDFPGLEAAYGAILHYAPKEFALEVVRLGARLLNEIEPHAGDLREPDRLRALLPLWLCPLGAMPDLCASNTARLCRLILALPQDSRELLVAWAMDMPPALAVTRLIKPLQASITHHVRFVRAGDGGGAVHNSGG